AMRQFHTHVMMLVVFALVAFTPLTHAQKTLTIAWAEWPPAHFLQELSKDFTAETGIKVEVIQIPWPSFQDQVFTAFVGKSDRYDIVIGDSQWLGRNSVGGHYIDLTDWMNKNIDVNSIHGQAMTAFAEYPKGSGKYWALPAEVDANGYVYRTDLFNDPQEKKAFKDKYGYDLGPPKTYKKLRDVAEFFTRPPDLYGIATYFSKEYDAITMGFQQVMWSFGASYGDPQTYKVDGYINSEDAVKALEYYKELIKFSPPDAPNYYWQETLDAYKAGKVAMAMDYFAFLPAAVDAKQNPKYHDKSDFFIAPAGPKGHYISIGGQGMSISSYSKNQKIAKQYMKWFIEKPVQEKWAKLGGFTPHKEVLQSDTFLNATPFNKAFAASFPYLRDFWAIPEYAELLDVCQTNWNAVIVGSKSPKAALDEIARKHEQIFEEAGYYD
ncbi:MAG: extracellular solute-binding protein, partial [Candidatus Poribacteria bacterium]|nr:extracellular solute-binding protein [Candidatus Poribacteria bacterium]